MKDKKPTHSIILSRRQLIQGGIKLSAGCFALGISQEGYAGTNLFQPSVYLKIEVGKPITFVVHRSEMGQHVRTSLAMLIAEELQVDIHKIDIVQAVGDAKYGDQNTDGSTSARKNWQPLRNMASQALQTLLEAGAQHFKASVSGLDASLGYVIHPSSGEKISYQDLAPLAARIKTNKGKRKTKRNYRYIGKDLVNLDARDLVTGKAIFGIDIHQKNMVFATIKRCPTVEGSLKSFEADEAKKLEGVIDIFAIDGEGPPINTNDGVVVVAKSYPIALKARGLIKATFDSPSRLETTTKQQTSNRQAIKDSWSEEEHIGDFEEAKEASHRTLKATFETPYLVHAQMEPLVCTAHFFNDHLRIWAPSQDPQKAKREIADHLDLDEDQITIYITFLGGGFGRKSQPDFMVEAAAIALRIKKPVKVLWTREDDTRHGFYHANSIQQLEATLDSKNQITGIRHRSAFPTIAALFSNFFAFGPAPFELGMGLTNTPYKFPNQVMESTKLESDIRIGWYRSVCNIFHAFGIESFLDEIAQTTNQDPFDIRLKHLEQPTQSLGKKISSFDFNPERLRNVLMECRKLSNWNERTQKANGLGLACHYSFLSYVAMVIEVEKIQDKYRATRVDVVADCGININSDTVKAQLEGGVIFGLSHSYYGEITLQNGEVMQSNFHDYQVLRMNECPEIIIHSVASSENPTGIGEPGVPPVAPALCNAISRAQGKRLRSFPTG